MGQSLMSDATVTKEQLERAISDLEAQRSLLGDAVVDPAIAALREQLSRLPAMQLQAADAEDERKIVTVMFADLCGFTQLAEKMDAEAARELVNACFQRFIPIVTKYGGTIDKFLGDGIMVLFGAPVAHENDPERALRAALELIHAIKSFRSDQNLSLGLHIGVNTGPVIAGKVGALGRQDYSVMGDAVNVAARLEDACGENEILIGPETFRQSGSFFQFEALPPIELRGKSEALPVYRLIGPSSSGVAPRISLRTPLFGREQELGEIRSLVDRLEKGEGHLLGIVGEAGLGKSRLILEMRQLGGSAVWAETRAVTYSETTGYRMARDLLHALIGTTSDRDPGQIGEILRQSLSAAAADDFEQVYPYLARVLEVPLEQKWLDQLGHFTPELLQQRILNAFQLYLQNRAKQERLVLVWEDIHWGDPSSLQVLEKIVAIIQSVPVLVIAVARPEGNMSQRIRNMGHLPANSVCLIELTALAPEASAGFVEAGKIDNPQTRQAILARAEGNPFFLEELIRAVEERGSDLADVPQTLHAVLAARIDSLPPEAKRILQRAAVIGRTFPQQILEYVCGQEVGDALDRPLKELCRRSFIQPELGNTSRDPVYVFHHAITQEVAYQSLLQTTRRDWHRLTGEAIETLSAGRLEEHSGILGRHFEQAGVREKAVRYFIRAADRARTTFSNLEAISFYRSALSQADIGGTLPPGVGLELIASTREALADVLALSGEFEVADKELERAQSLIGPSDRISHSRLRRKLASNWAMRREFEKTFACLDRAESELNLEGTDRGEKWWNEWAQIQHERLHLFYWLGQCSELNELAATIQPHLEKHGTVLQRGKFFMMRALSLLSEHGYAPPQVAVDYAQRSVDLTKDCDNPTELVHLWFVLGFVQLWRGNLPAAIAGLSHALRLSNQVGDLVLQLRCLTYLGVAHREMADKSAARDYAERALSLATRLQMAQYTAMANATLAWLAWKERDFVAVKTLATKALEQWHAMSDPYGFDWMALWPLIATAHAEKNPTEAIRRMRELFGPNQHPLPVAVATSAKKAIECASESAEEVNRAIDDTIVAARSAHQL